MPALPPPQDADCDAPYYGIGRAKDLPAAYHCYETAADFPMVIIMTLNREGNGESVAVDLSKVKALFTAWDKADHWGASQSLQSEALHKIVADREAGKAAAHIDFCNDVAGDTIAINRCAALQAAIAEAQANADLAKYQAQLSPVASARLTKVQAAFTKFKDADGQRTYQQYIEGTIRSVAAASQEGLDRDHYQARLAGVLGKHHLDPATAAAEKAADEELNAVYRQTLTEYDGNYQPMLKDASLKDQWPRFKGYIDDFKRLSKEAQLAWIAYRDAWADLAKALSKGAPDDDARGIRTAITRDRVAELTFDPVGPG
jgi:uncharacterized protein YecT (DUF1311 family)